MLNFVIFHAPQNLASPASHYSSEEEPSLTKMTIPDKVIEPYKRGKKHRGKNAGKSVVPVASASAAIPNKSIKCDVQKSNDIEEDDSTSDDIPISISILFPNVKAWQLASGSAPPLLVKVCRHPPNPTRGG